MEASPVKITPVKSSKRLRSSSGVNDIGTKDKSEKIIPNGTGNSSENPEDGNDGDQSQLIKVAKVGKKNKVDTSKSPQKSVKKPVKEPVPSASQESFLGFDKDETNCNKERNIRLKNIIDELTAGECASTTEVLAGERIVEDAEDKETAQEEEQEMTVDTAAAVSDETDSDQMEIDSQGERSKESPDVDIMDTESVKSDNVKTDTAVEKGSVGKVEYCGACSAQVDDAEEGICCDGACERWFHLKCSGLSKAEYNQLSLDENAMWACSKCSGKPPPILPAEPNTPKISVRKDLQKTPGPSVAKRKSVAKEGVVKTPKVDVSNPAYLKPFDFGWKRELVYRTSNENAGGKRNGDIYYYTSAGKKLRSLREISEHLAGTDLTMDNFTFWKEPLGIDDPEKEIIRDAKYKMAIKDGTASPNLGAKKSATTTPKASKTPKTTPKLTATVTPNLAHQIESNGVSATPKASASVPPRVVLKGKNSATPTLKVKIAPPKTVTPRPVITKGVRDNIAYRAMAGKTQSGLRRSSRRISIDSGFDSHDSNKRVATESGHEKKNKFRRYGLLANRRTSSPGSDDSSDSEFDMEAKSQPKKRGRPKKRPSNLHKRPGYPKEKQREAYPTEKPGFKALPFVKESQPNISFSDSLPIASCPYLLEHDHDPSFSQDISHKNRPVPPAVHFRPSNPSTYGCEKSPSMIPHSSLVPPHSSSSYQIQQRINKNCLSPLGKEPSGIFEFVSVTNTKQAVRPVVETSLPSPPSLPTPTPGIRIIECLTIEEDEDDNRDSPPDMEIIYQRDMSSSSITTSPYLYHETDPLGESPDPEVERRYKERRAFKQKRFINKQKKLFKRNEMAKLKANLFRQQAEATSLKIKMIQLESELSAKNRNIRKNLKIEEIIVID